MATQRKTVHVEEEQEAQERSSPSGRIVYKAILKEGEEELLRPPSALFWSAIAAGLSMGFSLFAEGLLTTYLPDAPWRPLVAKFGYCFGFLVVVLGRQQLFTENTLTPILPLLQHRTWKTFFLVARLWAIVLFANLIGAALIAVIAANSTAFDPAVRRTFAEIGHADLQYGFATTMLRGVFAGWLLALMVWLMPFAEAGRIWVIVGITYLVGLSGFSHIIAGSLATFTWAASEGGSWWSVITGFCVPCVIGNIFGGTLLVAVLNHAQVVSGSPSPRV
jgi:formate/nitrite transporter FocA (FNT family)